MREWQMLETSSGHLDQTYSHFGVRQRASDRPLLAGLWDVVVDGTKLTPTEGYPIGLLGSADYLYMTVTAFRALERLELNLLAEDRVSRVITWLELRERALNAVKDAIEERDEHGTSTCTQLDDLLERLRDIQVEDIQVIVDLPRLETKRRFKLGSVLFVPARTAKHTADPSEVWVVTTIPASSKMAFPVQGIKFGGAFPTIARRWARLVEDSIVFLLIGAGSLSHWNMEKAMSPEYAALACGELDAPIAERAREIALAGQPTSSFRVSLSAANLRSLGRCKFRFLQRLLQEPPSYPEEFIPILTAIRWHMRAFHCLDDAEAIVLHVIGLEALWPSRRYEKAKYLSDRIASLHIKGLDNPGRHLAELYRVRNSVAHSGFHPEQAFWRREASRLSAAAVDLAFNQLSSERAGTGSSRPELVSNSTQ
jgi:hypothetical protein